MSNRKIVAEEIAALKKKVKEEMQRRRGTNPITEYSGTSYDYTTPAITNNPLKYEHVEKNHVPLSKITGSPPRVRGTAPPPIYIRPQ